MLANNSHYWSCKVTCRVLEGFRTATFLIEVFLYTVEAALWAPDCLSCCPGEKHLSIYPAVYRQKFYSMISSSTNKYFCYRMHFNVNFSLLKVTIKSVSSEDTPNYIHSLPGYTLRNVMYPLSYIIFTT